MKKIGQEVGPTIQNKKTNGQIMKRNLILPKAGKKETEISIPAGII